VISGSGDRDHAQGGTVRTLSVDLAPSAAGWACCGPNCRDGSRAGPGWAIVPRHPREGARARRGVPPSSEAAARAGGTCGCGGTIGAGRPCGGDFASDDGLRGRQRLKHQLALLARVRSSGLPFLTSCRLDGKTGGLLRELNELDQTNNESYGVILLRRLDRLTPPQTVAFELDPMGVMNDTIKNGVGDCGITDYIVPLFDRNLACDEK
jgi:hypothetical protein